MATLSLDAARDLVAGAFTRCGAAPAAAVSTARALVAAEADGLTGHGLVRVPAYAAQLKAGKVVGAARVAVARPRPGLLAIDAGHGFAYPALDAAVAALPALARAQGVAAAGIRRSHHCGAAGLPVEALAAEGCVALMLANAPAAMAPWGGRRPVFGTDPLAFACPLPGRAPVVIDLALSKVARANVIGAERRGEPIPEGWALDPAGRPTTDAAAALAGTMLPMGDAKGAALALMVELLAAGLTGARFAAEASSFLDAEGDPPGTGQFLLAIDAGALHPEAPARFAAMAAMIEDQPGARLPGARRLDLRRRAAEAGLNLSDALVAEIAALRGGPGAGARP